jgi:hypothetical protein
MIHDQLYPLVSVLPRSDYTQGSVVPKGYVTCPEEELQYLEDVIRGRGSNQRQELGARGKRLEKLEELKRAVIPSRCTRHLPS